MNTHEIDYEKKHDASEEDHTLKGTIVSSSLVTAFIIIAWTAVFLLYLSRA
ncbi:MAG TPA: cytochrome c oxidase subunit 2A [Bacilli bacterium]